jgi:hypothetical protein
MQQMHYGKPEPPYLKKIACQANGKRLVCVWNIVGGVSTIMMQVRTQR